MGAGRKVDVKEKYLVIEEYQPQRRREVTRLLEQYLDNRNLHLTVRWRFFHVRLNRKLLDQIAAILYQQGIKKEFSVCCIVETGQWKEVHRLRRILNRYGFEVVLTASSSLTEKIVKKAGQKLLLEELRITGEDYKSLQKEYERYKRAGILISFDESRISSSEYTAWFQSWSSDKDACWLLPFREIIGYLFTGTWMETCEHDSCLGKYLCLDEDGTRYFCRYRLEGSRMSDTCQTAEEKLYDENYNYILKHAVENRRQCQAQCSDFEGCRGGCPLKLSAKEQCLEYQKKVSDIRSFLLKHSENYFADIANPLIRQLYLSTVAFGFIPDGHET